MGIIYRETYTKPLPDRAKLFTRKGDRLARWTEKRGRKRTAIAKKAAQPRWKRSQVCSTETDPLRRSG